MMHKSRTAILCAVLLAMQLTLTAGPVAAATPTSTQADALAVYVSPDGDDGNDGSEEQPFQTLARARDHVRDLIADGMSQDVEVVLRGGEYYLDQPLSLDERDSGRDGYTITYRAYPGETPVIVGGRQIDGAWEATDDPNIMRVLLPDVADGSWRFDQLYVDGERQTKARYPNEDTLEMAGASGGTEFFFEEGDLPEWPDLTGAQVVTVTNRPSIAPISMIDYDANVISLEDDLGRAASGPPYFIQGVRQELDAPGEFHLDEPEGYLYYWPAEGALEDLDIVAPTTQNVIEIHGSSLDSAAENIRFEDLTFMGSAFARYYNESHGAHPNHLDADNIKGVFYLENARNIAIQHNTISNAGFAGIALHLGVSDNVIYGNEIRNSGFFDILLVGTDEGVLDESGEQIFDNTSTLISNNYLHGSGKLISYSGGVFLHNSGGNEIIHNVINDTPHYGIVAWGMQRFGPEEEDPTRDNVVRYNDISDVVQFADDAGAITFFSAGPDNVIDNNRIHSTSATDAHLFANGNAHGVYVDNESWGTTVTNNLIYDIDSAANTIDHLGPINAKGFNNTVRNNVLIQNSGETAAYGITNRQHSNIETVGHGYERNIIYNADQGSPFYAFLGWEEGNLASSDFNLIYQPQGEYLVRGIPGVSDVDDWLAFLGGRFDQHSIFDEDPQFRDLEADDFILRPTSPAYQLGIEDIDVSKIGTSEDLQFRHGSPDRMYVTAGDQISSMTLGIEESSQLDVTARTDLGFLIDPGEISVSYSTEDETVAAVTSDGVVTGHAQGVTNINVTATSGGETVTSYIPVYVDDEIVELDVQSDETALAVDQQMQVRVTATTALGRTMLLDPAVDGVALSSSDQNVATVDENGAVTAVAPGTTTMKASIATSAGEVTGELTVDVFERVLAELTATLPGLGIPDGESATFDVSAAWSDGTPMDLSEVDLSYDSDDESIATVDAGGQVTGVSAGSAVITVTAEKDGVEKAVRQKVHVIADAPLPDGWALATVGEWPDPESYASYDSGEWTLHSNGIDSWAVADQISFVYQTIDLADYPDGVSIVATVDSVAEVTQNTMAGVMIRDDLTAGAKNVGPRIRPTGTMPMGVRSESGGGSSNASGNPSTSFPATLRLSLLGDTVTGFYQDDGEWVEIGQAEVQFSDQISVGIWNASNHSEALSKAVFSHVEVAAEPPVPASEESLGELQRGIRVATAHHQTSSEGDGDGDYPADARAALQTAIDDAAAVRDIPEVSEGQVRQAITALQEALAGFQTARIVTPIFNLDFEADTPGQQPGSVSTTTPENGAFTVEAGGSDGSQSMVITNSATPYLLSADVPAGETVTMYSMTLKPEQADTAFFFQPLTQAGSAAALVAFSQDGRLRAQSGDGTTVVGSYVPDQWYTVEVTVDLANQTFDVAVNGATLLTDQPLIAPADSIESIRWSTRSGAGTFWVDDVTALRVGDSDPRLAEVTVDGEPLAGFDPDQTDYVVELPPDAPVPELAATPVHEAGSVYITALSSVPGMAVLVGISQNRTESAVYEIEFVCGSHSADESITFGDVDSGVPNYPRADGCTFLDLVDAMAPFADHGEFVRTVRDLTEQRRADGLFTRREAEQVLVAAARADVP